MERQVPHTMEAESGVLGSILIALLLAIPLLSWLVLYLRGKQFALRDRLQKADAIVVLVGTRGNIDYLNGKICTAVHLYKQGWAPFILCSGKFSVKVTEEANLIPLHELQTAAINGRIQEKDVPNAAATWDMDLGAGYMCDRAIQMGVPATAILVEDESLHTRENAEHILPILKQHHMRRIILVTSPLKKSPPHRFGQGIILPEPVAEGSLDVLTVQVVEQAVSR